MTKKVKPAKIHSGKINSIDRTLIIFKAYCLRQRKRTVDNLMICPARNCSPYFFPQNTDSMLPQTFLLFSHGQHIPPDYTARLLLPAPAILKYIFSSLCTPFIFAKFISNKFKTLILDFAFFYTKSKKLLYSSCSISIFLLFFHPITN